MVVSMGVRQIRRVLQVLTVLSMLSGVTIAYFGIVLTAAMSSAEHVSSAFVTAVLLAIFGILYVLSSMAGLCGVSASKERLQFLMVYFYANIAIIVVFVLFGYMAIVAPTSLKAFLKHHWGHLPLRYHRCCRTFDDAYTFFSLRFVWLGVFGIGSALCLIVSTYLVIKLATIPVVMRHLLTVVNAMFILVGLATFAYGLYIKSYRALDGGLHWLAYVLMSIGLVVFILSLCGMLGAKSKSRTMLLLYCTGLGLCLVVLLISAVSAFTFASMTHQKLTSYASDDVACNAHLFGCSNCTTPGLACPGISKQSNGQWTACSTSTKSCTPNLTLIVDPLTQVKVVVSCSKCPEWTPIEVEAVVTSSLHLLGILSLLLAIVLGSAMASALILRRSLASYQTESI
ncbi:unnamed protein product [Aphanomyces euteiches]|uniref:Tetraspanin n=1 Tax=Aphanomyces euteiches TaxID=100861 RepID=A0A6G0WYS4_9STRA|nr:hypothetical protein Ae201684_010354 [Aphanomyces euteiches]KAH9090455.1 hypothetical protein Ae201684P_014257 [Aphanomyces euteiches]KAH9143132.1 hypothetical protein AeRB84_012854 [Aphanomyces euteiches]